MAHEPDLRPLMAQFPEKNWALPAITQRALRQMHYVVYRPGDPLSQYKSGYTQPAPNGIEAQGSVLPNLLILPGLAFDKAGYRLGTGSGYFDRYLAQHGHVPRVGVTAAALHLPRLPTDPWDVPVARVFTELG
jgi:5-formyltetrahydrofolate cyclo-ligase